MGSYCTGCESQNDDDARFCKDCGKAISRTTDIGFLTPYITVMRKYVTLDGRSTKAEYWGFLGLHLGINLAIGFVGVVLIASLFEPLMSWGMATLMLAVPYNLVTLPPVLAVTVRRLHDTGRRGWWLFLMPTVMTIVIASSDIDVADSSDLAGNLLSLGLWIPGATIATALILLVFTARASYDGPNRYGEKPEWPERPRT